MRNKKTVGVKILAEGAKRSKVPLKAVVYTEEKEEIKILSETEIEKEEFEIDLGIAAEDLPEMAKIAVIPQEVNTKSLIKRFAESGHSPIATIYRDIALAREGKLTAADLPLKPIDDDLISIWVLKRRVCGSVIKRDLTTGSECPVPGATVRVMDVDFHLFWWYPYKGLPWCWLFPISIRRREEIATVITDKCGRFCVDIPYFDIDAILRWRLRFRCLREILQPPRVIDAIDLGVKPDMHVYKELARLPELEPLIKPGTWPGTSIFTPVIPLPPPKQKVMESPFMGERMSEFFTKPQFEPARRSLLAKSALFDTVDPDKLSVLDRRAFPNPIASPALPDDKTLLKILPEKEMLHELRSVRPIVRLLRCWAEFVPDWHLFLDVPDIVFKVEQDIDGDGNLETIYDQGYFDVNWDLAQPTTNVVIEAWKNAICVPCGPEVFTPCVNTGLIGINEMPMDSKYLNTQGYAVRVNRPIPNGLRPEARTPFCSTLRLVGCPEYGQTAFYKVFYSYENTPETQFKESWYIYNIGTKTSQLVKPDANGFYPVLTPANNYFPYHTLINWPTTSYPNGRYAVRLELYDTTHNPIGAALPSINVVIDNSSPSRLDFLRLRWREGATSSWNEVPLKCPIIKRAKGKNIDLEIQYNVAADHLRDIGISFSGCDGDIGSSTYWHKNINDNNIIPPDPRSTWIVTVPGTKHEGGYYFYLEGRSRAFNGVGGLAGDWNFDTLHIWRGNVLNVVILDS